MTKNNYNGYTATIGIECHVQLKTRTKLFAPVDNNARDSEPNRHISHICLGMPGALPVLNEAALTLACRAAYALGTVPQKYSAFDRKHYFYPDLPKGYQITQSAHPIIADGNVEFELDGNIIKVPIERAHLEEDAGKSTHPEVGDFSLVDLNRAGTPLLEIVSAPAMHSPQEARAYAYELYLRMRYAGVSDADLYQGNMRFDVNVSVSKTDELGTRSETKNLNSFRSVERAVEYEITRQVDLLEKGELIVQETRGWDESKQRTIAQRSKEEAHDYRYFPEPDLPPINLDDEFIKIIQENPPLLPNDVRDQLQQYGIPKEQIDIIVEAELDEASISYYQLLSSSDIESNNIKKTANLMVQVEIPARREIEDKQADTHINRWRQSAYAAVCALLADGKLSSTNAKGLLHDLLFSGAQPNDIAAYAEQQGYIQLSDEKALAELVKKVIDANPAAADDVRSGEMKAIGFLVGNVMKASHGKANPALVKELLQKYLT